MKRKRPAERYARHKRTVAAATAEMVREAQEIAPLPPVARPSRRAAAAASLKVFCETYFPGVFYLPWSADHLQVIARTEAVARAGGLFAVAMPRGSGKSALTRTAALWAILTGLRRYAVIIAATAARAEGELQRVKDACETNADLIADWPEVLFPVARLERITQRQKGQTYLGHHTRIQWLAERVVFPTIPGSRASGAIITAAGLEGGDIRGQSHYAAGKIFRPDFVMVDDPQTAETAFSVAQCARRERLLSGDVLGMGGPGKKIAAVLCCTVIRDGDMADVMLGSAKHPDWNGVRTSMVRTWPTHQKLWDEYALLRAESLRRGEGLGPPTDFYLAHRATCGLSLAEVRTCATCKQNPECMDAGAVVAWPERFNADERSALQHAMNLRLERGDEAFFAEFQNAPIRPDQQDRPSLSADEIAAKVNGVSAGEVPVAAQHLTAFVDVHDELLYWLVAAWAADFTGWVIGYGTWPEQSRRIFTMRNATRTLTRANPGAGREGAIRAGLDALAPALLGREWKRADGASLRIGRALVDSGHLPDTVIDFCRYSPHAALLLPSRGLGITARKRPMDDYHRKPGELWGTNWYVALPAGPNVTRTARYDTNFWKTFLQARLSVALGDKGCLSLYGTKPEHHRLLAEHLSAEISGRTFGNGRWCDEWLLAPGKSENHWLDCLVGCAVAASIQGATLPGTAPAQARPRRRRRQRVRYLNEVLP